MGERERERERKKERERARAHLCVRVCARVDGVAQFENLCTCIDVVRWVEYVNVCGLCECECEWTHSVIIHPYICICMCACVYVSTYVTHIIHPQCECYVNGLCECMWTL